MLAQKLLLASCTSSMPYGLYGVVAVHEASSDFCASLACRPMW